MDLADYVGQSVRIRVTGSIGFTGSSFNSDIALDEISFGELGCSIGGAPTNLQVSNLPDAVELSWDTVAGATICQVQGEQILPLGDHDKRNLFAPPNPESFEVPLSYLGAGTTWRWHVRCACSVLPEISTPWSVEDTFNTPVLREMEYLQSELLVQSMNDGQLSILKADDRPAKLELYDLNGRLQFAVSMNTQHMQLSIADLPSGLYFLKVEGYKAESVLKY